MLTHTFLRRIFSVALLYTLVTLPFFAVWELVQLPLYTIWREQGVSASIWAAIHCTAGDAAIAFGTVVTAMLVSLLAPGSRRVQTAVVLTIAAGIAATIVSEIISTQWLARWAYTDAMPTVLGIGLSPLLQWLVVPGLGLALIRRKLSAAVANEAREQD